LYYDFYNKDNIDVIQRLNNIRKELDKVVKKIDNKNLYELSFSFFNAIIVTFCLDKDIDKIYEKEKEELYKLLEG
jgi:hypothetical protein